MRIELLRLATERGTNVLPFKVRNVVDSYCKTTNSIHLESGFVNNGNINIEMFRNLDLLYIKSYSINRSAITYTTFVCVYHPKFEYPYTSLAEFSQRFLLVKSSFGEEIEKSLIELVKEIHNTPAITLEKYKLN